MNVIHTYNNLRTEVYLFNQNETTLTKINMIFQTLNLLCPFNTVIN